MPAEFYNTEASFYVHAIWVHPRPQGRSRPIGAKLSPRGQYSPLHSFPGVNTLFYVKSSKENFNSTYQEDKIHPCGLILPLWANLTPVG
jgi:hypothetical protein